MKKMKVETKGWKYALISLGISAVLIALGVIL